MAVHNLRASQHVNLGFFYWTPEGGISLQKTGTLPVPELLKQQMVICREQSVLVRKTKNRKIEQCVLPCLSLLDGLEISQLKVEFSRKLNKELGMLPNPEINSIKKKFSEVKWYRADFIMAYLLNTRVTRTYFPPNI